MQRDDTIRLLCVSDPARHVERTTDIPLSYSRLASHPKVELYHADTVAMMHEGERIDVFRIPVGFMPEAYRFLPARATVPLSQAHFDLVFDWTSKPFPGDFLSCLQRRATKGLQFINDPTGVMRQLDPSFMLRAARHHLPHTLLTDDVAEAAEFFATHASAIAKRPGSCEGRDVFRLTLKGNGSIESDNIVEGRSYYACFDELFTHLSRGGDNPVVLFRYMPLAREGGKHIIVVDGEPYGAFLRRTTSGHWLQHVGTGIECELVEVTPADHTLVDETCALYLDSGVRVLEYDLLRDHSGQWLINEIIAGDSGGLFGLEYLGVRGIADRFVDWLRAL